MRHELSYFPPPNFRFFRINDDLLFQCRGLTSQRHHLRVQGSGLRAQGSGPLGGQCAHKVRQSLAVTGARGRDDKATNPGQPIPLRRRVYGLAVTKDRKGFDAQQFLCVVLGGSRGRQTTVATAHPHNLYAAAKPCTGGKMLERTMIDQGLGERPRAAAGALH